MVKNSQLFLTFFKIGTFTIGGGYAMIPLMEKELVEKRKWIEQAQFLDILSLSQSMPGIFAVNMATNIGFRLKGLQGAIVSVLGNIFMPIAIILTWAIFFRYFQGNDIMEACFKGVRPAVVALIAAPVFKMYRTAGITWKNGWIPLLAAILIWCCGVSPILIILFAALGSLLIDCIDDKYKRKGEK